MDIFYQEMEQLGYKFQNIKSKNGVKLIKHIINNRYNRELILWIITNLSKNKNKLVHEIYDYIIENTDINYQTLIPYRNDYFECRIMFIHMCAIYGNTDLLDHLIRNDLNCVDSKDDNGTTPLMYASRLSNSISSLETVKLLLDKGADVNIQRKYESTALILASMFSNSTSSIATVKLLLEYGANPDLYDFHEYTALNISVEYSDSTSSIDNVKLLLDYKANYDIENYEGDTPLIVATKMLAVDIVRLLLEYGADPNHQNIKANTALMCLPPYTTDRNDNGKTIIRLLLNYNIDLNLKNIYGKTAYDLVSQEYKELIILDGIFEDDEIRC